MRKYYTCVIVIIFIFLFLPSLGICESNPWTGNINLYYGFKNPSTLNDWDYSDYATEYGLFIDLGKKDWFVNLAADYLQTSYNDYLETKELNLGVRKVFGNPIEWAPYLGLGVTFVDAHVEFKGESDDDTGTGAWGCLGWYWNVFPSLNFAWEFRYSSTQVTLLDSKGDAGGWKAGVLAGYHF